MEGVYIYIYASSGYLIDQFDQCILFHFSIPLFLCFAGSEGDQTGEIDPEMQQIAEVKGAQQIPADGILLGLLAKDATRGFWPYY